MAERRLTHNKFGDDKIYANMRDKGEFTDAILCSKQTPSEKVLAHRPVLAAVSSIFKKKFKRSPDVTLPIVLKNVNHQRLAELIEFIYNGEIVITDESFEDFCSLYNCYNVMLGKEIDKKLKGECNSEDEDNDLSKPPSAKCTKNDSVEAVIKVERDTKENIGKVTQSYALGKRKYDDYDHTDQMCTHNSFDENNCPLMNPEIGWPSIKYDTLSEHPGPLQDSLFQHCADKQILINANLLEFAGISILKQKPKLSNFKKPECEYEEEDFSSPDVKPQINSGIVSSSTHHQDAPSFASSQWIKTEAGSYDDRTYTNHTSSQQHISQSYQRKEENTEKNPGTTRSTATSPSIQNDVGKLGPLGLFRKGPGGLYWILMKNISDKGRTSEGGIRDTLERFVVIKDFLRNPSISHVAYVAFKNEEEVKKAVSMLKLCQKDVGNTCTNVTELNNCFDSKYPPIPSNNVISVLDKETNVHPPTDMESQPLLLPDRMEQSIYMESRMSTQMSSHSELPTVQFGCVQVYIGNLPNKETDVNSLKRLFDDNYAPYLDCERGNSNYGIEIRYKSNTKPIKCMAFVYCKSSKDANIFVKVLNGKIYKNRQITVKLADDIKVSVSNLPHTVDMRSFRRLVNSYGAPYLRIEDAVKRGSTFVYCKNHHDARVFVNALDGEFFKKRQLTVKVENLKNSQRRNSVEREDYTHFYEKEDSLDYSEELSFEEEMKLVKEKMINARTSTQKDIVGGRDDSTSP